MDTLDIRNIGAAWDLFDELREQKNDQKPIGDVQQCPKCSRSLEENDRAEGYRVCPACGTVTDINVDDKAEWRNNTDGTATRTKANSATGKTGAAPASQRLQRSHQWNSMTSMERSMHQTMRYFENVEGQWKLGPQVAATATEIFNSLSGMIDAFRGGTKRCNNRQSLRAACLYFACKQVGCPRNRREVSEMLDMPLKNVTKGINLFTDIMGREYDEGKPLKARDFAPRYCNLLELPFEFEKRLLALLDFFERLPVRFHVSPCSECCGAIYFMSHLLNRKLSREEIHLRCGSSVAVMGKVHSAMLPYEEVVREKLSLPRLPSF
jgi:transcription initiation factor TFIIIB Brf1 subunit/transcription initiation factor TFIIB